MSLYHVKNQMWICYYKLVVKILVAFAFVFFLSKGSNNPEMVEFGYRECHMLSSWNKWCFDEVELEIRFRIISSVNSSLYTLYAFNIIKILKRIIIITSGISRKFSKCVVKP